MFRRFASLVLLAVTALGMGAGQVAAAQPVDGMVRLQAPATADGQTTVAISLSLPSGTAAVDGRVLLDKSAAEVVGFAPVGGGVALPPQEITNGYAFGAYGLTTKSGRTTLQIVIAPHAAGAIAIAVTVDAAADALGRRSPYSGRVARTTLRVGTALNSFAAPSVSLRNAPIRSASATRDLVADGALGQMDLDQVSAAWLVSHANDNPCAAGAASDANGDGCVDIVDVQAVLAAQGQRIAGARVYRTADTVRLGEVSGSVSSPDSASTQVAGKAAATAANLTFTVTSTADTADATNGDGICADSAGRCTLRAAITEANWQTGDNRIEFNLPGTAPVQIQISSTANLLIQDRSGALVIDGYTQPGSRVNDSTSASNAIPGVVIRGTGDSPRGNAMMITSANNTVRGLAFYNFYHGIFIDHSDAHDNRIVGNWVGYTGTGAADNYSGHDAIFVNVGANHNFIGTPALADRNVARATKALYMYGQGTDYNTFQNNFVCMTPSGTSTAPCSTGVDHDFGPKNNLVGGYNTGERNVIGATYLNGIEISHGYSTLHGSDADQYNNKFNRVIGNWIGFRGDGSYSPGFRSAQLNPGSGDNGNAINVYDGSSQNLIEGNYIASVWDGIQVASPNASANVVRGNTIGESVLGEPAPVGRDGIVARLNTRSHVIEGNTIRNVGRYGIGLIQKDVLWVKVTRNIITDTSGQAIYFAPDPSNPSTGADDLIPAPSIGTATTVAVSGTAIPGATVEVYQASRPTGQLGLPQVYLGSGVVAPDGTWRVTVALGVGDRATALQILPNGNTSGLSLNVSTSFEQPPSAPTPDFSYAQQAGTTDVQFTDASTGAPTSWNWTFGDGLTSTEQSPRHTYSSAGDYSVSLTVANSGGSNSVTKTVTVASPSSANIVASDTFGRISTASWGSADVGGAYTLANNAANYSVDGSVGTMTLPAAGATRSALLDGVSALNVDLRFRFATNKPANGGRMFAYAVARRIGTSEYRPRAIINSDGSVSVGASSVVNGTETLIGSPVTVSGITYAPGIFLWVRAQVTGTNPTTIRVKVWNDGQAEPSGWQFTGSNAAGGLQAAGGVGFRAHIDSSVTNAPVVFSFDDYSASTTVADTSVVTDTFGRTVSSTWSSADMGGNYALIGGQASDYNVTGGAGTINMRTAGSTRGALLNDVTQLNVEAQFRVAIDQLPVGGRLIVYAVARRNSNNEYRARLWINSNGTLDVNASVLAGGVETSLGPKVTVPDVTVIPGSFVWIDFDVSGASPTTLRVRAWADGQPEPATWLFTATDSTAALQVAGSVGMRAYLDSGVTNAPVMLRVDDYSVIATK